MKTVAINNEQGRSQQNESFWLSNLEHSCAF